MYNNKGGVSKTTTLFSLGAFLSRNGKKVLFADCDPQCNLTELFIASDETYEDPEKSLPGTSIFDALLPRFQGETRVVNQANIDLVESKRYKETHLLKGDTRFAFAETFLGTAWNQALTDNVNEKSTYVSIHNLLRSLGEKRGFDYVLCDVGPSIGAITTMVVLACDGIFVPLVPDRFCNQGVRVLGDIIHEWMTRHKQTSATFEKFGIDGFPGNPVFLGGIIQNFKIHSVPKAKRSYATWQERISINVDKFLLGKRGLKRSHLLSPKDPYIATIRDLGTLAPVAQMYGRAMFDVDQEHTKAASTTGQMYYGSVWQVWVDRMKEYEAEIEKIADALP